MSTAVAAYSNRPRVTFGAPITAVRRWLKYRETVAALRAISARQRADIGVEADIESLAWRMADDAVRR